MKLRIRNVAKIEEADLELNGITIIAGNNNTGKSTIGKIVFSLFNSLVNLEEKNSKAETGFNISGIEEKKWKIYQCRVTGILVRLPDS